MTLWLACLSFLPLLLNLSRLPFLIPHIRVGPQCVVGHHRSPPRLDVEWLRAFGKNECLADNDADSFLPSSSSSFSPFQHHLGAPVSPASSTRPTSLSCRRLLTSLPAMASTRCWTCIRCLCSERETCVFACSQTCFALSAGLDQDALR